MKDLLNINYYLFNNIIFYNKIIHDKFIKMKNPIKLIKNYYKKYKKTLITFNPFFGVKFESYFINKKNFFINNFYKKKKSFSVSYKDLSYIFNLSIEKIRIKCQKFVY